MRGKLRFAATSLLLILTVAAITRLGYAWEDQKTIPRLGLQAVPFLYEPGDIAYSIAVGRGFGSPFRVDTGPTAWTTPVYPLLIAGVFRVFGIFTFHSFVAAVVLNILFSTATCVPIFFTGKRIGGVGTAAGAAWLWAIFPNAVIIPFQWIWDTSLSGLLAAAILWATLVVAESRRLRDWCGYGLLWGLGLMTNATLVLPLPFLLAWMVYRNREQGGRWIARPALAASIVALCCLPWTARNYIVFHSFVPLRSVLGLQLWLGNNDAYRDQFPGWLHPLDNSSERDKYVRMGEIAYMQEKQREAVDWILTHRRREVQLFGQRFIATWVGVANPVTSFRKVNSLLIRSVLICNFLAATGALVGMIGLYRRPLRRAYAFPTIVFPAVFPIPFYLSQALFRYRYPIDPIVLLLASCAAGSLLKRLTRPGRNDTIVQAPPDGWQGSALQEYRRRALND